VDFSVSAARAALSFIPRYLKRSSSLDREHGKGVADKAKAAIEDTASKITGDKQLSLS
jgi:hypothetical protein